jgi:quinoprotein glucose dehydrogenase
MLLLALRYALCAFGIIANFACVTATSAQNAGGAGANRFPNVNAPPKAPRSIWDGIYTEAQAKRGHETYTRHCESCHQPDLRGLDCNPSLVGEAFARRWIGQSVGDIFLKVQTTMPSDGAASLSAQEYADVVSYVLSANQFPVGQVELPPDSTKLNPIIVEGKTGQ